MKIGFVGLGKMGSNMVERLLNGGHEAAVYDRSLEAVDALAGKGATGSRSLTELVENLPDRKVVWLMVPAGKPVDETIAELTPMLKDGGVIIDGGNSNWRETQTRAKDLEARGIDYIDCGTSGGVWGLKNGYCLMAGGKDSVCRELEPVFNTLAPPDGYLYCGTSGAGHFVKMVHNGIEYGMMQAYAEGFEIMEKSPFDLDILGISKVWQRGSVVRSWLLELAELAFQEDPKLSAVKSYVQDSGEGRWTVQAAMDFDVPAPVITMSLLARFQSRQTDSFAMKVLAALRNQFGGHSIKRK
ncbi:MAG: 6-phosphogluconate dehydrogenase [Nitrospinaceae bacterium]|nr:MAG: 6-phosphogluconate dehydrogenase [Nitrospinaceae bacterium]